MIHTRALYLLLSATLLVFTGCSDDNNPAGNDDDHHAEAVGLRLATQANDSTIVIDGTTVTGAIVFADTGVVEFQIHFLDEEGDWFQLDDDHVEEEAALSLETGDQSVAITMLSGDAEDSKTTFSMRALAHGSTTLTVRIMHGDHPDYTSPQIPISVGTGN